MTYTITFGRETWIGPDVCAFGDYGGAGSLGLANIREAVDAAGDSVVSMSYSALHHFQEFTEKRRKPSYRGCFDDLVETAKLLRELPDVIHATGDYGSECVLIRQGWDWGKETTDALEDYPCINDERVSEIEMEWEAEAWKDWLRSDLAVYLRKNQDDFLGDFFMELSDAAAWELYRAAMEAANEYPVAEHNTVHVDVDRVGPHLLALVSANFDKAAKVEVDAALRAYHFGQIALFEGEYLPDPEGITDKVAEEFYARFI